MDDKPLSEVPARWLELPVIGTVARILCGGLTFQDKQGQSFDTLPRRPSPHLSLGTQEGEDPCICLRQRTKTAQIL